METEEESFEEIVFVALLGFSTLNSMSLTAVVVMEEAMKEVMKEEAGAKEGEAQVKG